MQRSPRLLRREATALAELHQAKDAADARATTSEAAAEVERAAAVRLQADHEAAASS